MARITGAKQSHYLFQSPELCRTISHGVTRAFQRQKFDEIFEISLLLFKNSPLKKYRSVKASRQSFTQGNTTKLDTLSSECLHIDAQFCSFLAGGTCRATAAGGYPLRSHQLLSQQLPSILRRWWPLYQTLLKAYCIGSISTSSK